MSLFDESGFRRKVSASLDRARTILDNTRNPQYPADVPHSYDDKYLLADTLTNTVITSTILTFAEMGLTNQQLVQLKEWSNLRSVTLRFKATESCKFLRETTREVESDTKHVTQTIIGKVKDFTVTKITEYFWGFSTTWDLVAFQGNDVDNAITIKGKKGYVEVKTSTNSTPKPESLVRPHIDVNITWILQQLEQSGSDLKSRFAINRVAKDCATPRRNPQIESAFNFISRLAAWQSSVQDYIFSTFSIEPQHGVDYTIARSSSFVPVLPVFEKKSDLLLLTDDNNNNNGVIPAVFTTAFLAEEQRNLTEKLGDIAKVFPVNDKLVTLAEGRLAFLCRHIQDVGIAYEESINYIEHMLYNQIVAAIGREVTPVDFTNYLDFHNRKFFKPEYAPTLFCHAVRRPGHYPEGTLSIEAQLDNGRSANPITTICSHQKARSQMTFNISASTQIGFYGERFLHGWVNHQFAGYSGSQLSLVARARQFSSFILLVGRIISAEQFEPKYGIIIQNRDELKIPLNLETIPSAKEFKKAIESISPDQQRFAKAFRAMQLESTLFGVCVVQIKPQLEKLLNLPDDSLTKEIELSQDLLNLFIKYQIPSDLLTYDGPESADPSHKVGVVKQYVKNMNDMVAKAKDTELQAAQQEQLYAKALVDLSASESDYDECEEENELMAYPMEECAVLSDGGLGWDDDGDVDDSYVEAGHKELKSAVQYQSRGGLTSKISNLFGSKKESKKEVEEEVVVEKRMVKKESKEKEKEVSKDKAPSKNKKMPAPVRNKSAAPKESAPAKQEEAKKSDEPKQDKKVDDVPDDVDDEVPDRGEDSYEDDVAVDYTKIPSELEAKCSEYDVAESLRPTIINPGAEWSKKYHRSLLSAQENKSLYNDEQESERNKAFDLLDALTRSGVLSIDEASLHVVIASTHCFDKTVMNTLVQANVNPIEKVEQSSLLVASTIHQVPMTHLINSDQLPRLQLTAANLLEHESKALTK